MVRSLFAGKRELVNELFVFPSPQSALSAPELQYLPGRTRKIVCNYESPETGAITWISLTFTNCYAIKITNGYACDLDTLERTYRKVVDLGGTKWRKQIKSNLSNNAGKRVELKHFGIYFDNDCLYEFICESFNVSTEENSNIAV